METNQNLKLPKMERKNLQLKDLLEQKQIQQFEETM
jgi:hypothetical protein